MANRDGDVIKSISNELRITCGYFTTDGAGAFLAQTPSGTLARQGIFTISKPAGTGIYQVLMDGYQDIFYADANVLTTAGTLDRDIQPILPITASSGIVQFQCRKTSDGTAVDLLSGHVKFLIIAKNSAVYP